ncbi:MAG: ArsR/SmtB family transcription factor [Promethearchaeota archaeon]
MEELIEPIANFLKVLADITRLKIIKFLKDSENTANNIQTAMKKSQSTISQQLKILTNADILEVRRVGAKKVYKIKNTQIFDVISFINTYLSSITKDKIEDLVSLDILDTLH